MTLPSARQLAREANTLDVDLMRRIRARDVDALRAFYDRHVGMVYGLGRRILGAGAAAEDVAQDVFLEVWRRAARFDVERGAFPGWLVSLAHSRAIEHLQARDAAEPAAEEAAAPAIDPNESAYASALRSAVARALGTLPEAQRTALEHAYFGGMSHEQIAQQVGAEPGAVRARIRQAMMRMRDLLGEFATPGLVADTEE